MNETLQVISQRFSCRNFTDMDISNDNLQAIVNAGLQSPSGMNLQPWHIIVVNNKKFISELDVNAMQKLSQMPDKTFYDRIMSRGGKLFYNASAMIVIAKAPTQNQNMTLIDCGILAQNIVLAAASLDVNSVHVGSVGMLFAGDQGQELKTKFRFPEGYEFGHVVLLGHSLEQGAPHQPDQMKVTFV